MCECRVHTQPLYALVTFIPLHVYYFPFLESFRKKFFIFYDSHMCIIWHIHAHHHKHHLCVLVQLFLLFWFLWGKIFEWKIFFHLFCILNEELLTFFLLLLSFLSGSLLKIKIRVEFLIRINGRCVHLDSDFGWAKKNFYEDWWKVSVEILNLLTVY